MNMFCYQCQEALKNQGCTSQGVCGKTAGVANLQDDLIAKIKLLGYWGNQARKAGKVDRELDRFVIEGLFATVTNVDFDPARITALIKQAETALNKHRQGDNPPVSTSVLSETNEDIRSLKELLIYGLKGMAAYADHAWLLGYIDDAIAGFIYEALAATLLPAISADELVALVIKAGEFGVKTMALLDRANTETFGQPEITVVSTGTKTGPAILVSGHDLLDLLEILKQTEGKGINVYTHGEMLPALAYPKLKKFAHLAGNYGSSWFNQQAEFAAFNGAIVMTTNCLQKPLESYQDRIFTTGLVAWPGVAHIADRNSGQSKDFSPVIAKALSLGGLKEQAGQQITIGFAHDAVMQVADKIIAAVKTGAIKRFVVMAGCDGRHKEREYFSQVARQLPKDAVILTAGCAKYRYNMLNLGEIGGIPRVIDAGQCNDSYSLAVIALKLKEVFGLKDINDLPLSFDIAWYEQKAVIVLLALLYLGVKGIRLGPTLPAFVSKNVADVLVKNFNLKLVGEPAHDVGLIMAGQ
ncbi:hydroxylamine reductase [candidate division WOR-1 bacterium RIFOXYB2_FULL_48_7]|uniref:Hydroxylamine reductase n=1 Tax=candidate division WOR-1 bacterium RIFOXYB2_FULL_48_7 TaxID=1802583 RepID=A0A1F4TGZ1_UNCSA|nr:MAG: hydroxylamine reductase [candidate division WOR-1 bacterium RIFOXYB2_FULL_48_7]